MRYGDFRIEGLIDCAHASLDTLKASEKRKDARRLSRLAALGIHPDAHRTRRRKSAAPALRRSLSMDIDPQFLAAQEAARARNPRTLVCRFPDAQMKIR